MWVRPVKYAAATRSEVQHRSTEMMGRAPRPVQLASELVRRTGSNALTHRVPGLAAEAALFTLISLPALLLAIIASLSFVAERLGPEGSGALRRLVFDIPRSFLSEPTFASYQGVVDTVLAQTHGSVVSFSILLSVWTGSRAVNRYLETITIAYGLTPRPGWKRRLLALGLTLGGLVAAVAVLPPLVAGPRLVRWVMPDAVADTTLQLLHVLFWPALTVAVVVALATLYHVGAPWKTPWRRDLAGAVLAMALWLLASAALRTYLNFSVDDNAAFRLLAVPIAVVLWLYLTAAVTLLGAEFNAAIEQMWPYQNHPSLLSRLHRRDSD